MVKLTLSFLSLVVINMISCKTRDDSLSARDLEGLTYLEREEKSIEEGATVDDLDFNLPQEAPVKQDDLHHPLHPNQIQGEALKDDETRVWLNLFSKKLQDQSVFWIAAPRVTLHSQPHGNSTVVGELDRGQQVVVIAIDKDWAKLSNGTYVPTQALSRRPLMAGEPVD